MTNTPEASVIVATYNGARTIGEQFRALVAQIHPPKFEVIVVDNGRNDGLHEVIDSYRKDLNIRVISAQEKSGQAYARNTGAIHAQGAYLLFCDQDDRVGKNWVNTLTESLKVPGCFVTGPLELRHFNNDAARVLFAGSDVDEITPYTVAGYLPFAYGCNLGMRRDDFLALGGFDNSYQGGGEDQDLSWRAIESGLSLEFADGAVVSYRLRQDPRMLFRQQRGYGKSGNLLRMRFTHRGVLGPSPRWVLSHLPHAMKTLLRLKVHAESVSLTDAKAAGYHW